MNFENIKTDPSKSSILENIVNLELDQIIERPGLIDNMTNEVAEPLKIYKDQIGERYVEILESREPRVQKFASLMIKGVVNGADIIEKNNKFYSHIQESKNIKDESENLEQEIFADFALLYMFLNSTDHGWENRHNVKESHDNWKEAHNTFIDYVNNKVYYFDFEKVSGIYDYKDYPENYEKNVIEMNLDFVVNKKEGLEILRDKIEKIINTTLSDIDIFKSIIKKSGVQLESDFKNFKFKGNTEDEKIEDFFNEFKFRAEKILQAVEKKLDFLMSRE